MKNLEFSIRLLETVDAARIAAQRERLSRLLAKLDPLSLARFIENPIIQRIFREIEARHPEIADAGGV